MGAQTFNVMQRACRCSGLLLLLIWAAALVASAVAVAAAKSTPASTPAAVDSSSSPSTAHTDLHTHSTLSDGSDSPMELVRRAAGEGVTTLALTEHDQLSYDPQALAWAASHGIQVIRGTEISCEFSFAFPAMRVKPPSKRDPPGTKPKQELHKQSKAHLLGYYTHQDADASSPLEVLLAELQEKRKSRNSLILRELKRKYNIDVSEEEVVAAARASAPSSGSGQAQAASIEYLGRPHIAKALVAQGAASSILDAFQRFLSDERLPLPEWSLPLDEAIEALAMHGAVPVLAHPITLGLSLDLLEKEVAHLLQTPKGRFLRGIEVYSSKHDAAFSAGLLGICDRLGLLATGGSDFHGKNKDKVPLARMGQGSAEESEAMTAEWEARSERSLLELQRLRDEMQEAASRGQSFMASSRRGGAKRLRREGEGTGSWNEIRAILLQLLAYAAIIAVLLLGARLYEMQLPPTSGAGGGGSGGFKSALARWVKSNAVTSWLFGNSHSDLQQQRQSANSSQASSRQGSRNGSQPHSVSGSPNLQAGVHRLQVAPVSLVPPLAVHDQIAPLSSAASLTPSSAAAGLLETPPPTPLPPGSITGPISRTHGSAEPCANFPLVVEEDAPPASMTSFPSAQTPPRRFPSPTPSAASLLPHLPTPRSVSQWLWCFLGLQVSYLSWGYLQERIMTLEYIRADGKGADRFQHSDFLVLMNRVLGGVIALTVAVVQRVRTERRIALASRPPGGDVERGSGPAGSSMSSLSLSGHLSAVLAGIRVTPPFKYALCSLSNVLSSWLQYEALKYVSFPLQVLSKSSKILFTMIAAGVVEGKRFPWREYVMACAIAGGLVLFRLGEAMAERGREMASSVLSVAGVDSVSPSMVHLLGVALLLGYIAADSFTSTWQSRIFRVHKVSSLEMMVAVNSSSAAFSLGVMVLFGKLLPALAFVADHPLVLVHAGAMSFCAAIGQLFIFHTISTFGAVSFASMMTARQLLSLALSLWAFKHELHAWGYIGLGIVSVALAAKVWEDMTHSGGEGKDAKRKGKKEMAEAKKGADDDEDVGITMQDPAAAAADNNAVEMQRLLPVEQSGAQ